MKIKKEKLIKNIHDAFKDVKLEDGIGLWEAQGYDDRLSNLECKKLRAKDEINDWTKIPVIHLYQCSSSLSFFDAKGMRFHLPIFLLLDIDVFKNEEEELYRKRLLEGCSEPCIEYQLIAITDYLNDKNNKDYKTFFKERFSLFNNQQLKCIVEFLEYKMYELETYYQSNEAKELGLLPQAVTYNNDYLQLQDAMLCWIKEFEI